MLVMKLTFTKYSRVILACLVCYLTCEQFTCNNQWKTCEYGARKC